MRHNKASLWLGTLLVLAGCPQPPPNPPEEKPQLTAVTVTCEPPAVPAGRATLCKANATKQDGTPFTVSGYTWTSSNEAVAKVDPTGRALTFTTGTATLRASATADGITQHGEATLTVTEAQPTLHSTPITANETWRAAENPHVVRGSIEVGGGATPTLTLEEGVQLRFELDAELRVTNGALKAMGTQAAPIHMTDSQGTSNKGLWRGIVFVGGASASELNHVMLSGCGRPTTERACIALKTGAAPVLRHVTVRNSGSVGIAVADDGSAFGTGSTTLSVSGSEGYAVRIGANQASSLPTGGTFTDNVPNAVELLLGEVSRSQTWPNPGIPYVVNGQLHVRESDPNDQIPSPTLALSAGTVLRFGPGASLFVGDGEGGGLSVDGTAASPILFTADSANPQPGHWRGVHIRSSPTSPSRISHATFEYAGASSGPWAAGNLNLFGNPTDPGIPINNVIVQNGSKAGIHLGGGYLGQGSTGLTVRDNGGHGITAYPDSVGSLSNITGLALSGNARQEVAISVGLVQAAQTWPKLDMPYLIAEEVQVDAALTLLPGTELRFAASQVMRVSISVGVDEPGALIAKGTAEAPIRFIPNTATPTKGHWHGLYFVNAGGSRLDHVVVTHAGAGGGSNVRVNQEIGAFVTNSTISNSSGCGIVRASSSTDFTQATYNNTFTDNTGGAQCTIN